MYLLISINRSSHLLFAFASRIMSINEKPGKTGESSKTAKGASMLVSTIGNMESFCIDMKFQTYISRFNTFLRLNKIVEDVDKINWLVVCGGVWLFSHIE